MLALLFEKQIFLSDDVFPCKRRTDIIGFVTEARKIESLQKSGKVKTFGDAETEIWY